MAFLKKNNRTISSYSSLCHICSDRRRTRLHSHFYPKILYIHTKYCLHTSLFQIICFKFSSQLLHCNNYKITENLTNLHKKIKFMCTLSLYKYVAGKTIVQILQKQQQGVPCGYACLEEGKTATNVGKNKLWISQPVNRQQQISVY